MRGRKTSCFALCVVLRFVRRERQPVQRVQNQNALGLRVSPPRAHRHLASPPRFPSSFSPCGAALVVFLGTVRCLLCLRGLAQARDSDTSRKTRAPTRPPLLECEAIPRAYSRGLQEHAPRGQRQPTLVVRVPLVWRTHSARPVLFFPSSCLSPLSLCLRPCHPVPSGPTLGATTKPNPHPHTTNHPHGLATPNPNPRHLRPSVRTLQLTPSHTHTHTNQTTHRGGGSRSATRQEGPSRAQRTPRGQTNQNKRQKKRTWTTRTATPWRRTWTCPWPGPSARRCRAAP